MAQYQREQDNRREQWWIKVKKRRSRMNEDVMRRLAKEENDFGASRKIQDQFEQARLYAKNHPDIVDLKFAWWAGLFWSGSQYDIILYDDEGKYKRFYNKDMVGPP